MTGSADKGRAVDVFYLNFSKAFGTISQYKNIVSWIQYSSMQVGALQYR